MIRGLGGPCASVGNGVAGYGVIGYGVAYGGGERYGVGFKEGFGVGCDDSLGFPEGKVDGIDEGNLEEDGFHEGISLGFPECISLGDTLVVGPVEEDGEILGCDVTLRQWKNPAPLDIQYINETMSFEQMKLIEH